MRILVYILMYGVLPFVCLSCTEDIQPEKDKKHEAVLWLDFGAEGAGKGGRSVLSSAEPLQHVTTACLYIYKGTGDDASLVACENLGWIEGTYTKKYKIRYMLEEGQSYTLMAVGMDKESATAYQWPALPDEPLPGDVKLGTSKAVFNEAGGATLANLAKSEFFVGTALAVYQGGVLMQQHTGNADTGNEVRIEMKRRTAGILLYVKDIPCTIDGERTTRMELVLGSQQRSELVLRRKEASTSTPEEVVLEETGVSFVSGSEILMNIPFPSEGYVENGTYQIAPPAPGSGVQRLPNTLLKGVYLLPLERESGATDATLTLHIYGENDELLKSFPVQEKDGKAVFDVASNHIYSIGIKWMDNNTENDAPISLSGDKIILDVKDWEEVTDEVIFPNPDALAGLKPEFNPNNYIFNSIDHTDIIINAVLPDDNTDNWNVTILNVGADEQTTTNCDWLWIRPYGSEDNWEHSYSSPVPTSKKMELFMNHYAVKAPYAEKPAGSITADDIRQDYRTARILLTAGTHSYTLNIRQYNAITVKYWNEEEKKDYYAGFSRLDYGDEYDRESGESLGKAEVHGWGYFESKNDLCYVGYKWSDYDGLTNWENIEKKDAWKSVWKGSALQICHHPFKEVSGNALVESTAQDACWFFPSIGEMAGLISMDKPLRPDNQEVLNLRRDEYYWSSSPDGIGYDSYRIKADAAGKWEDVDRGGRNGWNGPYINLHYLRQACRLK